METPKLNPFGSLMARQRKKLSFPAKVLFDQDLLLGDVLDFGYGFGSDVKLLQKKGIRIEGYDKDYHPIYPIKRFDTIICLFVLNHLMPEEQVIVLMKLSQLVKPTGKAYIAVRRDLKHEGFKMHKRSQKKIYYCKVNLNLKSIFKNEECEIYEYKHYNQLTKSKNTDCIFCNPDSERKLIVESETTYAIFDKFPVNSGHALIIPKRHCEDYFDLTIKEQSDCMSMLNEVKEIITDSFNPDGFNVGINIGEKAGQTIPHVHIHLIPRYQNDVEDPRGGVRGVIPSRQKY